MVYIITLFYTIMNFLYHIVKFDGLSLFINEQLVKLLWKEDRFSHHKLVLWFHS
jgi:hypothetical protein